MVMKFIPKKSELENDKNIQKLFLEYLNENYPEWREDIPPACCERYRDGVKDNDWRNWVYTNRMFQLFISGYESNN